MKPKIFIDGEHGTTGLQIRTRLAGRTDLEVLSIPEEERRNKDLRADLLRSADIAILCLPDDASREAVILLEGHSTRIIDTSTAHRTHSNWVYGFAELEALQAQRIREARLVANPGCYPTGAISLIRPLRDAGLMNSDYPVTVNAVSGYTGGGKQMIAQMEDVNHPEHMKENNFLYGLTLKHKHLPEMQMYGKLDHAPIFAPSVGRFAQGMIVQVPVHLDLLKGKPTLEDVHNELKAHYSGQKIVRVVTLEESSAMARVDAEMLADTDGMNLYVFGSEGGKQINLVAVLDNLGKGASGAAVQNMNLMLGLR
ncbi:N-acetyl-gamma-glutamyl-phosphate reductase [Pseudochrobactrum sp. XF203]|uniref:N-acetyl-gamma-glutamyl-phosphate reductase n=1 Tax=Pseudochrobactrum sp. XF203 TaxID=2879116 RepID=UPI001CE38A5B|nr:N-acetyl-gamma-glutamyl-phosphate reductase [Pseudochrobactrum sp. XF203]UCA46649.1 N-acetyl-gamma-glutamyl-phosphate reductase [Pseudochrobactrum sp. XF203]